MKWRRVPREQQLNMGMPSVLGRWWLGSRKGIRPVKECVVGWGEVQICIWPS